MRSKMAVNVAPEEFVGPLRRGGLMRRPALSRNLDQMMRRSRRRALIKKSREQVQLSARVVRYTYHCVGYMIREGVYLIGTITIGGSRARRKMQKRKPEDGQRARQQREVNRPAWRARVAESNSTSYRICPNTGTMIGCRGGLVFKQFETLQETYVGVHGLEKLKVTTYQECPAPKKCPQTGIQ